MMSKIEDKVPFFYNPTKFLFRISSTVQKDKTSPIKWHESNHARY